MALAGDDPYQYNLNFRYIDIQIIRIITSTQDGAQEYSRKAKNQNQSSLRFTRLILGRVIQIRTLDYNSRLIYIMEARNMNNNLWMRNVHYRNNGLL